MKRQDDLGDDGELGARLDAYVTSRLEPDPAAAARTRRALMADAHRVFGAAQSAHDPAGPAFLRQLFRRPALAASFALLGLAVVAGGAMAASAPGGPLYGARLWAETLTLPSDAIARASAELDRLQARLDEATTAAASGNGDAVTAALDAYRQELPDAQTSAGGDASREERLATELGRHQAVLGALAGRLPTTAAQNAIERAVQRTKEKIDAITRPGQPAASPNPGKPAATPGPGKPNRTPNPGGPKASPTPDLMDATPKPGNAGHPPNPAKPSPKPGAAPTPGGANHSPNPGHTPDAGHPGKTPPPYGG